MKSLWALEQFIEYWRDRPGFMVDPFGNATFQARVQYARDGSVAACTTIVRIRRRGAENGKIRIKKDDDFFAAFPHLDFEPPWHEYKFDGKDNSLMVLGHSERLKENYVISILPA